jgi:pimeloyl-ACP methyl ester carboxylesterase
MVIVLVLLIWAIIAPGCMTFRNADKVMIDRFKKVGVDLTTTYQTVEGTHIHYAKTGFDSLPTIVFIHGTPGSWDAFSGYMRDKDLLQHFRMVSIDRPGFGYSDFGKVFHLKKQAELIEPVLKKLQNGKPVYLAGHSLGGPLIVQLAADEPQLCQGLIIISGSVDPAIEKAEKWRPWLFKTPLNFLIPGAFKPSNEELWYLKKDLVRLKDDFARITCPVYFIHGDVDTWVPISNVDYARKLLVNTNTIGELVLPGGNHFIPWTKFNEIKNMFLELSNNFQTANAQVQLETSGKK